MGCVLGNKTVIVGNGLAGGPVKNCPLNVFQLSKHWCLSLLRCVHRGSLELTLPSLLPGEQPQAPFACFLLWLCHSPGFQSCGKALETVL